MHAVPVEERRETEPRNCSYRWLGATLWVLGIGSGSSARAAVL